MDIQIRTARAHPRDMAKVKDRIAQHIADPDIAESMWYTLKRGGESIVGPSVRLAEILYAAWGNIRIMSHVVETTATHVTARGVAMDLENNTGVSSDATVPIHGRGADAIKTAHMRAQAVARRNATFQVIPGVYQKQAMQLAQRAYNEVPIEQRRAKMVEWFADQGVVEDVFLHAIGKDSVADLTSADLEKLRGIANKIVDENKAPQRAMGQQADAQEHAEADHASQPEPSPGGTPLKALEIDARKKFGKHFDSVWEAAEDAAGMDYDMLRAILSAPKNVVVAAATGKTAEKDMRTIAKAQAKSE
jgi:hypothetical protein